MDISWKFINLGLGLFLFQLCNGYPINLENSAADSHSQLLTGLVAVLLTVCSVVFLAGCLCCQRRNGFKEFRDSPVVASTASNLDHGHVNPVANGEFTIFTPLSPPHQNNNVFLANQQIITRTPDDYSYGDVDVSSWFTETEKDFPRIKLKYIRELGRGWFGKVVEGAALDISSDQQWTPVVVRILDASAASRERVQFLHDAAIYKCGRHPNLLTLIGRCLDTIPLLLLQEYCPQGDLKAYLKDNNANSERSVLSTEYPLIWCCQLTSALKHLHDNNITHPDLATRNCQLTSNLTLKLGDYGLSVICYPDDYYQGSPGVPVRWCAPESLICTSTTIQPTKVTKEGNIWSLGVTMWEICECGQQPYAAMNDDEVVSKVLGSPHVRLTRPSFTVLYTDYIYRLMQLCWTEAESRPAVAQIDLMLADLLLVHKNTNTSSRADSSMSSDDFDKRWESFKPNELVKTDNHMGSAISENDVTIEISKPLSPSLNNLHGSLDNLLVDKEQPHMDSWLENVVNSTNDLFYAKDLSQTINDLDSTLAQANVSSPDSSHQHHVEFKLGPKTANTDQISLNSSTVNRTSSESETEDENWRKKIELGAYTEKVRQKSKSVADLMVLTHIEYSESESETPLPSLDYRVNYKNVRLNPKNSLENASMTFGSEGNLLSIQDTFQDELKKLQDERRDSLLFVPDKHSQSSSVNETRPLVSLSENVSKVSNTQLENSPSKRLMQELNSGADIKPANQVYNVFNVTIDKFSPLHVNTAKLNEIINLKDVDNDGDVKDISISENKEVTYPEKLSEDVETENNQINLPEIQMDNDSDLSDKNNVIVFDDVGLNFKDTLPILEIANSGIINENKQEMLSNKLDNLSVNLNNTHNVYTVPSLVDMIQNSDELMEYIIAKYDTDDDLIEKKDGKCEAINENVMGIDSIESIDEKLNINQTFIKNEQDYSSKDNANILITQKSLEETKIEETTDIDDIPNENQNETVQINYISNNDEDLPPHITPKEEVPPLVDSKNSIESEEEKVKTDLDENSSEEKDSQPKVMFDLSKEQQAVKPNLLTHSSVFTSTPFKKKNIQDLSSSEDTYTSINIFNVEPQSDEMFSSNFAQLDRPEEENKHLNYSLETWDNFLGKTLDSQSQNDLFDSFSSEPQSLLFFDTENVDNTELNKSIMVNVEEISGDNENSVELEKNSKADGTFVKENPESTFVVNNKTVNETFVVEKDINSTFIENERGEGTFVVNDKNTTFEIEDGVSIDELPNSENEGTWEAGGGWFLHPQSNSDDISGEMVVSKSSSTDSYVGFSMDDEIMAAIRNELLTKLPHAQGAANDNVKEDEEWESGDTNEVFLRYNVYNTPLSPIPEESLLEDCSGETTPRQKSDQDSLCSESDNDDDPDVLQHEMENPSVQQSESSIRGPLHRHTPSQDSCCSNDTLFNLEELTCGVEKDVDNLQTHKIVPDDSPFNEETLLANKPINAEVSHVEVDLSDKQTDESNNNDKEVINAEDSQTLVDTVDLTVVDAKSCLDEFLASERENSSMAVVRVTEASDESNSDTTPSSGMDQMLPFLVNKVVPPLPSPEDKPWKQLPASMLTYENVVSQNNGKLLPVTEASDIVPECSDVSFSKETSESHYENIGETIDVNIDNERMYENIGNVTPPDYENVIRSKPEYESVDAKQVYENIDNVNDIYNEADYVNIVNFENTKNSAEYNTKLITPEEAKDDDFDNKYEQHDLIINNLDEDSPDLFGVLTDIRFNGPGDNQFMSTSFSESNDNDEQDWDSGSETGSSSSGEFIWKEGEHEESLKALRAAPQDLDDLQPLEAIAEEPYSSGSSVSSGSSSSDEGEIPEFVPSAWDKYATPTKSALRSPEKTLERDEKKSKGVWFKKQKYHCVYEYPREPESPVLQSQDLWKPQSEYGNYADWDFDADTYLPPPTDDNDILSPNNYAYQQNSNRDRNLYQLTNITSQSNSGGIEEDFFISSSAKPFDMISSLSSQFFPGNNQWAVENMTPDSGMEDITPGSLIDDYPTLTLPKTVPPLKKLAADVINQSKKETSKSNDVLGGLRHTRNKLKLDLPPSPSAFTNGKVFTVEPNLEPIVLREKPTFSTFGKSRFSVQHVDTPPEGTTPSRNVSFEALPYKPLQSPEILDEAISNEKNGSNDSSPDVLGYNTLKTHILKEDFENDKGKCKVEVVRGEASLLDSADEDSGIESSTLERKLSNAV